jgi:hypothetical protein
MCGECAEAFTVAADDGLDEGGRIPHLGVAVIPLQIKQRRRGR